MRVLIACEFSGTVRDAFLQAGEDAWSCDLLDTENPGPHLKGDIRDYLGDGWDLMIAHPPCTDLAASGASHWRSKGVSRQRKAVLFALELLRAPIKLIALENPIGALSTWHRKPDQIIHPYMFGDATTKATCLWLKNLPRLRPTMIVKPKYFRRQDGKLTLKRYAEWHIATLALPLEERRKERSRTFASIAQAMAAQWNEQSLKNRPKRGFF